jgi:hypothetical protein
MIRETVLLFAIFALFENGIAAPVEPINEISTNQEIKEEPKVATNSTTNDGDDSGYVNILKSDLVSTLTIIPISSQQI